MKGVHDIGIGKDQNKGMENHNTQIATSRDLKQTEDKWILYQCNSIKKKLNLQIHTFVIMWILWSVLLNRQEQDVYHL